MREDEVHRERREQVLINLNGTINMKILTFIQPWLDCLPNQTHSWGFFIKTNSTQTWIDDQIDLAHVVLPFFSTASLITCDSSGEIFLHASEFIRPPLSSAPRKPVNRWSGADHARSNQWASDASQVRNVFSLGEQRSNRSLRLHGFSQDQH